MTKEELDKRLEGKKLTKKLALELSIEKWERLAKKTTKINEDSYEYPRDNNCALCRKYLGKRMYCPLKPDIFCFVDCHKNYIRWCDYNCINKITERNEIAEDLVKIMKEALEKK